MKKTKYYFTVGGFYNESCDWGNLCASASENGILLYKEKSTNEMYAYEDVSKCTLSTGTYVWEIELLRVEEVEIKETVTKLPLETRYKNGINWKASKRSLNPGLQKTKKSKLEEEKRKRDLEFFKMRENFKLKKPK